jgi:hypothetical protein
MPRLKRCEPNTASPHPKAKAQAKGYPPGKFPDDLKRIIGELTVQSGVLYRYVNGQQVVSWDDNLNPSPGVVRLLVECPNAAPSSYIPYSNFELDM